MWRLLVFPILLFITSCASFNHKPSQQGKNINIESLEHSVFLIANTDQQKKPPYSSAEIFEQLLSTNEAENTILLLGNNSVRSGTPDTSSLANKKEMNEVLKAKYDFYDSFKGNKFFVSGQNEWDRGGKSGMYAMELLEAYVEQVLDLGNVYVPDNGCPGPTEIPLTDDVVLLLINTQWWMHNWERPGIEEGCNVNNEIGFLDNLDDAIKRNYNKKIIVAGHHSLQSSGKYGGYFSAKSHLFPLTLANENLYIPMPVLGSIYVLGRRVVGEFQDVNYHLYRRMVNSFQGIFAQHPNLIYVSGHELSLEYNKINNIHAINSGSFSKGAAINTKKALFAASNTGFGKLDFYINGDVYLRFYDASSTVNKPIFEKLLFNKAPFVKEELEAKTNDLDYAGKSISTHITDRYTKKSNKPGAFGNNYREEWKTEVKGIPYFDLKKERGGLDIVKKGGGMQTRSLRLEASNKKQYVLRSINKYPENAVPVELRGTFAENLIAEQISSAHPYAAFAIPSLADAVGIYHTNPKLVYLPDDPRLGIYRKNFGGGLYLYEERPDNDWSDHESFGYSNDIKSTDKVVSKILGDGDHVIDQYFVVKSRLFDIMIGDWDRHDDQWRWATFDDKEKDIKLYRPIPRDRDQAFFWSDGWVMKLISHRWGMPKFQGFHHKIRDVEGFCFNARYFDRTFMNEASLDQWIEASEEIKKNVTDEIIERSIRELPPEIFNIHGDVIISKLKSRRDDLTTYAKQYYLFLAKEVDIRGTLKRDRFDIKSISDEELEVSAYRVNKHGEIKYRFYHRVFRSSETKEIRVFGLNSDDVFNVIGNAKNSIKVRLIGGNGEDEFKANEKLPVKTLVYDTKSKTEIDNELGFKNKTSNKDPFINAYDRKAFKYDLAAPTLYGGFNPDDGVFVGFGGIFQAHGFRKYPYKSSHFIVGTIAPKSTSFNVAYKGSFTEIIRKWNVNLNAAIFYPSYSDFFYGYGNETINDEETRELDRRHYAVRFRQIYANPEIFRSINDEKHTFTFGATYQTINIRSDLNDLGSTERYITQFARNLNYTLFDVARHYAGMYIQYEFDTRNNELYPQSGLFFKYRSGYNRDIDRKELNVEYGYTNTSLSGYFTFGNTFKSTIALRIGTDVNEGQYELYQANKLGGTKNLRGYRKQRFAGDRTVYQNTELRVRLFNFKSIILPGDIGITLFHDIGKIWMDDDPSTVTGKSTLWHRGYGFGVFLAPFEKAVISSDFSWSNTNESSAFVRLGFLF